MLSFIPGLPAGPFSGIKMVRINSVLHAPSSSLPMAANLGGQIERTLKPPEQAAHPKMFVSDRRPDSGSGLRLRRSPGCRAAAKAAGAPGGCADLGQHRGSPAGVGASLWFVRTRPPCGLGCECSRNSSRDSVLLTRRQYFPSR